MAGFQNLMSGIQGVREQVQGLNKDLENVNSIAQTTSTTMKSTSTQMAESARSARENVEQELTRAQQFGEDFQQNSLSLFLGMEEDLSKFGTLWNTELQLAIDAVKAGKLPLQEFIDQFGDWVIQVEDGSSTIRRELDGIDPKVFENRIRSIIDSLREGSASTEQAIARLRELGGTFADQIAQMFDQLKKGEITIESVFRSLETLRQSLQGEQLGDLAGTLQQALRNEDI